MGKLIRAKIGYDETVVYGGVTLTGGKAYLIKPSELAAFQNDQVLIDAINSETGYLTVEIGNTSNPDRMYMGPDALNELMSDDVAIPNAFASKQIEGKKVFRRKHGQIVDCLQGETKIDFVVPYERAKINLLEIVNGQAGDTVDLKVYDNAAGTISGVANQLLNQFGFDVALCDGMYKDKSDYDADVIQGMKIEVTYKNNGGADLLKRGFNIVYHELK